MRKKLFVIFLVGLCFLVGSLSSAINIENEESLNKRENELKYYPVMKIDSDTVERWDEQYNNAKQAYIDPNLNKEIQATESYSILDLLDYIPEERSQGRCGNCWAWTSTAVLAMALNVQEGIKDRLSVQFMNTCGEKYTTGLEKIECCGGGTLDMLADFYTETNFAIPWSNDMAHWHDGGYINCITDCSQISKTPNYPIYDIDSVVIPTRDVTTEEAIQNIKNVLHQQKGVYFSVFYPDLENLDSFRAMWQNDAEDEPYDLDYDCGSDWDSEEAVGHAMLIVGYNDVEGTENDYWIVLNSWGTTDNRPNGLLSWDMDMNYACKYSNYYAFGAKTLEVDFDPDPEAPLTPTITGPSDVNAGREYTFELSAEDPQGDDVEVYIKWKPGFGGSGWLGPYASGEKFEVTHTWTEEENVIVKARARDPDRNTGPWASFEVSMSRDRQKETPFFDFLKEFPIIYRMFVRIFNF
jgi:C1A family cysteine protease